MKYKYFLIFLSTSLSFCQIKSRKNINKDKKSAHQNIFKKKNEPQKKNLSIKNNLIKSTNLEPYKSTWVEKCQNNQKLYESFLKQANTKSCKEAYERLAKLFDQVTVDKMEKKKIPPYSIKTRQ